MSFVIDQSVVDNSVDASFAYIRFEKDGDNWKVKEHDDDEYKINFNSYKEALEDANTEIKILDHVHDEATGFQATLIEKTKTTNGITTTTKTLAIAGTDELVDIVQADFRLADGNLPAAQFKSMTDFVDGLKSKGLIDGSEQENLTVTGHSLGGALAQICTAVFSDYFDQAYTYNSPGAKDLVSLELFENNALWTETTQTHYNVFLNSKEEASVVVSAGVIMT